MKRDMRLWTRALLETTAELDYAEALDWFGLAHDPAAVRPSCVAGRRDENGKSENRCQWDSPRLAAAAAAGLSLLDEIVAVNGAPLPPGQIADRLAQFSPGASVSFTIVPIAAQPGTIDVVLAEPIPPMAGA